MKENRYLQWVKEETPTRWWNDSALRDEVAQAIAWGASGVTTNPCIAAATLETEAARWQDCLGGISPDARGDAHAVELEQALGGWLTKTFAPQWAKGNIQEGGVCCQVSPAQWANYDAMMEQVKLLGTIAPNIFVKVPATRSGLRAFEKGISLGINMVSTVSFTVAQVVAAAEAQKRGEARARAAGRKPGNGIAVIMIGRVDEFLREVVHDGGLPVAEADIQKAGVAIAKKAYRLFSERGYATIIMIAGARSLHHITELIGGRLTHSIAPSFADMLAEQDPPRNLTMDTPVDPAVIDRLMQIPEFRMSYEEDGMDCEKFISYPAGVRIATQFVLLGWNHLSAMTV